MIKVATDYGDYRDTPQGYNISGWYGIIVEIQPHEETVYIFFGNGEILRVWPKIWVEVINESR